MKKVVLFFAIFGASAGLCYADNLSVESIVINPPTSGCQYQWIATIRNNDSKTTTASFTVQGAQYAGSDWHGAGGTSISDLAAGQSTTRSLKFLRRPNATDFKIVLRQSGQEIAESQVPLPAEPPASLKITDAQFNDNGYFVDVHNNASTPITEVMVQGYMAAPQEANTWTPIGGSTIQCIGANSTGQRNTNRSAGWNEGYTRYKILVKHGGATVIEEVFDLTPPQSSPEEEKKEEEQKTIKSIDRRRLTAPRIFKRR